MRNLEVKVNLFLFYISIHNDYHLAGFNYAYRRSATSAGPPGISTLGASSNVPAPPSVSSTPAPGKPQQSSVSKSNGPSAAPTPPPQQPKLQPQHSASASGKETPTDLQAPKANGSLTASSPVDKAEKQKGKKDKKKDKSGESKDIDVDDSPAPTESKSITAQSSTPSPSKGTVALNEVTDAAEDQIAVDSERNVTSPSGGAESPGSRTPVYRKNQRQYPWTLFMKFSVQVTEAELREFFGDAKEGVCIQQFIMYFSLTSP